MCWAPRRESADRVLSRIPRDGTRAAVSAPSGHGPWRSALKGHSDRLAASLPY